MRLLIQRVHKANITIDKREKRSMSQGLVVLAGMENIDTREDIEWASGKISRLRIFDDNNGVMNLSVTDIKGEIMLVSQFTLHASTKKGNRPSYIKAAKPEISEPLYNEFLKVLSETSGLNIIPGKFGAHMDIELINNGPVTIFIDTKQKE